jgi:hypothetical protein
MPSKHYIDDRSSFVGAPPPSLAVASPLLPGASKGGPYIGPTGGRRCPRYGALLKRGLGVRSSWPRSGSFNGLPRPDVARELPFKKPFQRRGDFFRAMCHVGCAVNIFALWYVRISVLLRGPHINRRVFMQSRRNSVGTKNEVGAAADAHEVACCFVSTQRRSSCLPPRWCSRYGRAWGSGAHQPGT